MSRQIKSSVLVGVTIGILLGCSAPALAQFQMAVAERYKNDSGATALCLRKVVYNYAIVGQPQSDEFANCTTRNVGTTGYTVIDCSGADGLHGGAVLPGEKSRVAFVGRAINRRAEVICAKWYTDAACTVNPSYATPVPFVSSTGNLSITVEHGAQEWTDADGPVGDPLGTINGSDVYFAVADEFLPVDEVEEILWTCHEEGVPIPGADCRTAGDCSPGATCGPPPGLTWEDPVEGRASFQLEWQEQVTYDLREFDENDVILFRFYTEASGTDGYEVLQFRVSDANIPTITEWGVAVMTVLLLTAATIVLMRRRAMPA